MDRQRDDARIGLEADGYFLLFVEAEQAIRQVANGSRYVEAQTGLIKILFAQGKAKEAATLAERLLARPD